MMIKIIRKDFLVLPDTDQKTFMINRDQIAFITRLTDSEIKRFAGLNLPFRCVIVTKGEEHIYTRLTEEEIKSQLSDMVIDEAING